MSTEISSTNTDNYVMGAEELESLYLILESSKIPELNWKNPGRREENKTENNLVAENQEIQEPTKNDFDFNDDFGAAQPTQMRTVRTAQPKSAKKKTANFADIVKRSKNFI